MRVSTRSGRLVHGQTPQVHREWAFASYADHLPGTPNVDSPMLPDLDQTNRDMVTGILDGVP
ncbi:MAG: hypothetical protein JRI25_27890 [Deltaproteobacteria bacterium]|nr:hypothetical protein [Deltaproteobacteria bacterium]